MNQPSKALCVKITGKDSTGVAFNEAAWIDQYGNFGTIVYTNVHLNIGDRLYMRNTSGEVVATGEVVWRHVGEAPAVEVLLKKGYEVVDLPPIPTEATVKSSPSVEKPPQVPEKKREELPTKVPAGGEQTSEPKRQQPPSPGAQEQNILNQFEELERQAKPRPSLGTQERRPASSPAVEEKRKPTDSEQLERQASLEQFRKIGIAATIVFAIFLGVLLSPIGKPEPTRFHLLQQRSCVEANSLGGQSANQRGELEFWAEDKDGQIVFFRREDVTPPQGIEEIAKQTDLGNKVAGLWCPKEDVRIVEDAGASVLPGEFSDNWNLLPVGKNASQASKISFYIDSNRLIFLEDGADRTSDIANATYYDGSQKLVIRLNDMTATDTKPAIKELKFYLPRAGVSAVAESRLADSTWQSYTASSNPRSASTDMRFIATLVVAALLLLSSGYVAFNLIQSRK